MRTLLRVVVVVLVLELVILSVQYAVAGAVGRKNPVRALGMMMPAYLTALGTSSSAATIPVTLAQTRRNGVSDAVASFTVPLCATIHLAGSTSKIFAFAFAIALTCIGMKEKKIVGFFGSVFAESVFQCAFFGPCVFFAPSKILFFFEFIQNAALLHGGGKKNSALSCWE